MVTVEDVRALALRLPRSYEVVVRGRLKFRVGQIVYLAFSRDESIMGFAFPKEWREAIGGIELTDQFVREFVVQRLHKCTVNAFTLPRLRELGADLRPDRFLYLRIEITVFNEEQHHVGSHFLRPQRRHSNRHLDELVEIIGDEFIVDALEVTAHGVLNHRIIGGDHESGVL